jgi:acetyltransferase EpsM
MKKYIILGAGRHALETYRNFLNLHDLSLFDGFYEDKKISNINSLDGYVVGDINSILSDKDASSKFSIITAIGSLSRITMINKLKDAGFDFFNIVAKGVELQSDFRCGKDVYLAQGVVITSNVQIGSHVIVNINTSISHDTVIGNNVIISPGVTICGKVKIEDNVFIGAGATIIDGIKVASNCFIAAGSCVVKDVEPNSQVGGVPAKFMKKINE